MRFKIDWASLIVGSKFTVFALFYFVFEGNFPSTSPPGGLYLERRFNGGFFVLLVWGAYIWRGLFSEVYGMQNAANDSTHRIWFYNVAVTCIDYTVLHQLRIYYIYFFVCRCLM